MNTFKIAIVASSVLFAACTLGEDTLTSETPSSEVLYLDTDGDGEFDAIDVDGDGVADYYFDGDASELDPIAYCSNPFVDVDNDGFIDGIDFNCDGIIDIPLTYGGGGGGNGGGNGGVTNQCRTSINGKEISCRSENGGPANCECKVGGSLVSTCSTNSNSACSQPGNGNCCGF